MTSHLEEVEIGLPGENHRLTLKTGNFLDPAGIRNWESMRDSEQSAMQ